MLLLLEIVLTVRAWKKGWGGRALIPGACALGLGILVGVAAGPTGSLTSGFLGFAVLGDLAAILALWNMAKHEPAASRPHVDATVAPGPLASQPKV
jgi:hypothetical protein